MTRECYRFYASLLFQARYGKGCGRHCSDEGSRSPGFIQPHRSRSTPSWLSRSPPMRFDPCPVPTSLGIAQARTIGQLLVKHHPLLPLLDGWADRAKGQCLHLRPVHTEQLHQRSCGCLGQVLLNGFHRRGLHCIIGRAGALGQASHRAPPRRSSRYSRPALPAQRVSKPPAAQHSLAPAA